MCLPTPLRSQKEVDAALPKKREERRAAPGDDKHREAEKMLANLLTHLPSAARLRPLLKISILKAAQVLATGEWLLVL